MLISGVMLSSHRSAPRVARRNALIRSARYPDERGIALLTRSRRQ
jgi:hypothetical protein